VHKIPIAVAIGPQINRRLLRSTLATFVVLSLGFGGAARAETVNIGCENAGENTPAKLTLTYEGGASGTLTVKAPFGDMSLPATREEREDTEGGEKLTATGIRAFGPVTVAMPDKAAIEACVAQKLKPDEAKDEDIVATVLGSCAQAAAPGKPVAIKATVEIGVFDPPSADVDVTRTFLEASTIPGGVLKIETFPSNCSISK
jgi:hypothetical protein